jgi:hypothetical protein
MARFGIPESITMDNVMVFKGAEMRRFTQEFGIALINSTLTMLKLMDKQSQ